MPQKILGIDIGSYSIKVAEFERSLRHFSLVGFFEQPIGISEALGPEASTTQALARLFEEYNLAPDQVYTALPGQMSSIRVIDLPFGDFKKVDATIEFEMEGYLPFALDEVLIDYQFLEASKTRSTVLAGYARKSEFVKFMNIFSGADLDPRFVGCEPVEMASVMKLGGIEQEGAYAVVDIGHEKTNVAVFSGSQLQYARTILAGGRDLTQAIADSMNIPPAEAERMKVEMGQVGPEIEGADQTTRALSEAMKGPLQELLLQLKQTFMAFRDRKGEVVQALLLCGGTSRLMGIDQYLSSELRKNVSFLDCLDFPFNQLADSAWCRPVAATAVALAYRGVIGAGMRDIQFRRGEFAYRGEAKNLAGIAKQVVVLLGIASVFAVGSFVFSYATLKRKVSGQMGQIASIAQEAMPDVPKKNLSSPNAILSALTGRISEAEEKKKKVEDEVNLSVLDILKEFSAMLPDRNTLKLDVDDMTIAAKKIRVKGRTDSFPSVSQIKESLSKSKMFKNVTTENVKKGIRDEIRFDLSLEVADLTPDMPNDAQAEGQ